MHNLNRVFFVLAIFLFSLDASCQSFTVIKVNEAKDANGAYAMAMVDLALSKIEHNYIVQRYPGELTQSRNIEEVASGKLDLMWAATNIELEDQLSPVRIPLYKGLLGHRIFIIHPDSQHRFDKVVSFDDLKQFKFGQGRTWADTQILESNGLEVVKVSKYAGLFHMVDGGRFDAFPRGVQEPIGEISKRPELKLEIEQKIMLVYKMPFYLFTSKANRQLKEDLERGLNLAISDGSFDNVFLNDPTVKSVLENIHFDDRLVFELKNLTLPADTPIGRPELWLDINQIKVANRSITSTKPSSQIQ